MEREKQISEGKVCKGGLNRDPQGPRPEDPVGQEAKGNSEVNDPYTPEERVIAELLRVAFAKFIRLDASHPSHHDEFVDGIHACQDVLIHRVVQRDYPETFPTYKRK